MGHSVMKRVAVIGAGPAGLAAVRYLRDEGFEVTAFEQRSDVGGIWCVEDATDITSATEGTKFQVSKYMTDMIGFPYPEDAPTFLKATDLHPYYKSYAETFNLYPHIEVNKRLSSVRRNDNDSGWLLQLDGEETPRAFDRVIWATGTETIARPVAIEGAELFDGQILHGQAYKRPEDYKHQRIVILGFGNSAVDAAVDLTASASEVYISHRRGGKVIPRFKDGRPLDAMMSWTFYTILITLQWYVPSFYRWMTGSIFDGIIRKNWGANHMKSRFHLQSGNVCLPRISDRFIPLVREGAVVSVPNIKRITGPKTVELEDGGILQDIDTIIACTGYELDFAQLESVFDMHHFPNGASLPDLYMNVFPPQYADSFAFLTCAHFPYNACTVRELSAMAVAQIWAGKSDLPSAAAMTAYAQEYQKWYVRELNIYPDMPAGWIHPYRFLRWVHDAAGTGMYEHIGWFSWPAWKLWWNDRKLYRFMTLGVLTPHMFVLFETGKRKAWKGARDAIIRINEQLERDYPKRTKKTKKS